MQRRIPRVTRDLFLMVTGVGLTIHEALIRKGTERPFLLAIFAGMMGLPVFLSQGDKPKPPDPPTLPTTISAPPPPPPPSPSSSSPTSTGSPRAGGTRTSRRVTKMTPEEMEAEIERLRDQVGEHTPTPPKKRPRKA